MARSACDLLALVVSLAVAVAPVSALAQTTPAPLDAPPPPPTSAPPAAKAPAPAKAAPAAAAPAKDADAKILHVSGGIPDRTAAAPAPTPPPPPSIEPELRKRLDQAMGLMLSDEWAKAEPILATVAADAQDPELRGRALALLAFARARETQKHRPSPEDARAGRFPFVFSSTVGGIGVGLELDFGIASTSVAANVGIVLLTTGAAFAASLLATRTGPIREGEAVLYSDGMMLGTYDAILLAILGSASTQAAAGVGLLGTIGGGALGFFGGRALHVSPGAASLAGSGAIWGTVTGLILMGMIPPQTTNQTLGMLLVATNAGVAIGLGVGVATHLSRTRVLLMDLGGLLGGLALGGIGVIIEAGSKSPNALTIALGMTLVGIYGGGGLSLYLTRNFDASSPGGGGGSLLSFHDGRLGLGVPLPEAMPDPAHPGHLVMGLSLASGTLP